MRAGSESGKVHSTVKERWAQRDPSLVEGMRTQGQLQKQPLRSYLTVPVLYVAVIYIVIPRFFYRKLIQANMRTKQ
jgi:hypothetical protein